MRYNYVNIDKNHNKFWCIEKEQYKILNETKWVVKTQNGRLGTKGTSQPNKHFNSESQADCYIISKVHNKTSKGYKQISDPKLSELNLNAAIVGSSNKCNSMEWVKYDEVTKILTNDIGKDVGDPSYEPLLFVSLETRKAYVNKNLQVNHFDILITSEKIYVLTIKSMRSKANDLNHRLDYMEITNMEEITSDHKLHPIAEIVRNGIGRML